MFSPPAQWCRGVRVDQRHRLVDIQEVAAGRNQLVLQRERLEAAKCCRGQPCQISIPVRPMRVSIDVKPLQSWLFRLPDVWTVSRNRVQRHGECITLNRRIHPAPSATPQDPEWTLSKIGLRIWRCCIPPPMTPTWASSMSTRASGRWTPCWGLSPASGCSHRPHWMAVCWGASRTTVGAKSCSPIDLPNSGQPHSPVGRASLLPLPISVSSRLVARPGPAVAVASASSAARHIREVKKVQPGRNS